VEQPLQNSPEEKLILPAMYNLYKIYQITKQKAARQHRKKGLFPNSAMLK
jgi:hypothetical protein